MSGSRTKYVTKTYVVLQRNNVARPGQANSKIIAVRLTRAAADAIRDANPGSWVEKHEATK